MGRPELQGLRGLDVWAGFLVLDAWIANTDRHHENWGVLIDRRDRSTRLAPSFDHGSSLGFNVPEAEILDKMLRPGAVDQWCRRGRSGHFSGRPTLTGIAAEALDLAGSTVREHWLSRLHGPPHLRLLCRLEATDPPGHRRPGDPDFDYVEPIGR